MQRLQRKAYTPRNILCILCLYKMFSPGGTWTFLLAYQKQKMVISTFFLWLTVLAIGVNVFLCSLKILPMYHVAKVLYNEMFTRHGLPSSILSDRGQICISKLGSSLCALFEVTRIRTSSFHPQTNSICEWHNSTLAQCLRAYCHENQDQWSELLPSVMMAFRMTPGVQTTGYSPYRILFIKEMTLSVYISLLPQEPITQAPK